MITKTNQNTMATRLIELFEARLAWEALPTEVRQTRDGWAAYKGAVRITKFFFSANAAENAGLDWDNSGVEIR